MKIEIDISGQVQQLNFDSAIGFKRDDGFSRSVYLKSEVKKEIIKKYKGQITNIIEKLHCIIIYYCIKDFLGGIDKIVICRDVDFRRVKNLLPLLCPKLKPHSLECGRNVTAFNFGASKKQVPIKPHSPAGDFLPQQKTFRVWWHIVFLI